MKFNLILTICILAWVTGLPEDLVAQNFEPTFTVSKRTTHKIKKDQAYTFGYLKVLENRQDPDSRTIKIPVYIFKSRSKNPKPDPIIYTVGGPGSTTMPSAQYMQYYPYLDDRDFILVEQRGTYYAKPHLDCPEWAEVIYQSHLPGFDMTTYEAQLEQAAQSCRDRLLKKGIDLNGYHTLEIAADINDLVEVLQIERYNLLTLSYSTKIAQVLMRDYPERIRSVVMDSPLPLEVQYEEESVGNLLETLDKMLTDCALDSACRQAYPNLKERFHEYLIEKTQSPLEVQVEHPQSGEMETFYLKGEDLITVFSYASTGDVVNLPFEIQKLLDGDLTSVRRELSSLFQQPIMGDGMGMRLSVWCAEEQPFNSPERIHLESTQYPEVAGLSSVLFGEKICGIWGVERMGDLENQAVTSGIPVLLMSGEYDSDTPVKWAKAMQQNLTNSHHLIFPGWKHSLTTYWSNPCARQAAQAFFNLPTEAPQLQCFEQLGSPEFKIE
ncbi:MAG: alpha/beta fold hydrolase [Bacteroidota bacterium]